MDEWSWHCSDNVLEIYVDLKIPHHWCFFMPRTSSLRNADWDSIYSNLLIFHDVYHQGPFAVRGYKPLLGVATSRVLRTSHYHVQVAS